jgi:hypothetical protein
MSYLESVCAAERIPAKIISDGCPECSDKAGMEQKHDNLVRQQIKVEKASWYLGLWGTAC